MLCPAMNNLIHKLVLETIQDGVFIANIDGVKYVNDSLLKMIGYSRKEVLGKKFTKFIFGEDIAFVIDRYTKRIAGEKVENEYEFRLKHKNGSTVYVIVALGVIDYEGPAITGTIKDITDRIQSELKIKEIENSYRTLLELCPDPIIVSDFNGIILLHNKAAYDVHEAKSTNFKLLGTNVSDYMATKDEKMKIQNMAQKQSDVIKYMANFKTQRGRIIPFELHTATVYDSQGIATCKLTIGRDISQIKEDEKTLEQLILDKELFIKEIHHRIKNNLQQVYSLLGLQLENEFLTKNYIGDVYCDKEFTCFNIIRRVVEDARRRILAISLVHEMFYKHNKDCIEFELFLNELCTSIKNTYDISDKDIKINISGDSFELCLDYIIPCGLIANEIIINAFKYAFEGMESGTIDIKLHRSNGIREITISDNGVGMTLEDVAKSKTLGMSLVGGLTEQIGGTFDIRSDEGKGTTYKIVFKDAKTNGRGIYGTR